MLPLAGQGGEYSTAWVPWPNASAGVPPPVAFPHAASTANGSKPDTFISARRIMLSASQREVERPCCHGQFQDSSNNQIFHHSWKALVPADMSPCRGPHESRRASAMSLLRLYAPSLLHALSMCCFTVFSLISSSSAMDW